MAEFLITFDDAEFAQGAEPAKAVARVRLDRSLPGMVEFEVDLNEIPVYQDTQGKDIVVDWSFPGMNMGNELWYSTNGLQMLNKTLNHREQFNQQTNQTFSSNFYPVTTSIAGRDTNSDKQVVILNDRTQAGAVGLRNSNNIELM